LLPRRLDVNRLEIGKLAIARKHVPSGSSQAGSDGPLLAISSGGGPHISHLYSSKLNR